MADNDQRMKDLELLYNAGQLPEDMKRDYELVRNSMNQQPEGSWLGAVKQLGIGALSGLEGFAGDVVDLARGAKDIGQIALDPFLPEPPPEARARFPSVFGPDTAEKIQTKLNIGEPPKDFKEGAARSIGGFAGNPLSWLGPENWFLKAGEVVAGGAGSETLGEVGQAVGGDTGERIGRVVGGALGGGAAGAAERARLLRRQPAPEYTVNKNVFVPAQQQTPGQPTKMVPQRIYHQPEEGGRHPLDNEEALYRTADAQYNAVRQNPIQLTPAENNALFTHVLHELQNGGATRRTAGTTFGLIDDQMHIGNTAAINTTDILDLHNRLGQWSVDRMGIDPTEARTARQARDLLRNTLLNMLKGPRAKKLRDGIGNWAAMEKIKDVRQALDEAISRAAKSGSGKNAMNTMRQEISKIIDSDKRSAGYSQAAFEKGEEIARGTPATDLLRNVSKSIPFTSFWAALTAILTGKISVPIVAAVGVIYGSRAIGDFLTRRQINQLVEILKTEAPANARKAARNALLEQRLPHTGQEGAIRGAAVGATTDYDYLKHARKAPDGKWYVPDPRRPGKYLEVVTGGRQH